MSHASRTANIEELVDELIALYLAQAADLREYAQAAVAGEGTVHLKPFATGKFSGPTFTASLSRRPSRYPQR